MAGSAGGTATLAFGGGRFQASTMISAIPFRYVLTFIIVAALAGHCFSAAPAVGDRDLAWERQALLQAEADRASGAVRITREASTPEEIQLDFELKPGYEDPRVRLAVAVPDSEIAFVSVKVFSITPEGPAVEAEPVGTAEHLGWVRGYKLARVHFPTAAGVGQTHTSGTVTVTLRPSSADSTPDDAQWVERETTGPLFQALQRLVANPSALPKFLVRNPASVPTPVDQPGWHPMQGGSPFRIQVPIEETGLYRISGADLQSSGVVIGQTNPQHLRLFADGQAQPLHYVPSSPSGQGSISPSDQFLFYGYENPSPYSATNMYWLVADAATTATGFASGGQVGTAEIGTKAEVYLETARAEQDLPPVLTRNDQFLTILGFRWVWWTWTEGRGAVPDPTPLATPRQVAFSLPGLYTSGGDVTARAYLYNHIWPSGRGPFTLRVRVNDAAPIELTLESAHDEEKEFRIPAAALRETNNVAVLELADAGTSGTGTPSTRSQNVEIGFDRLEVDYPRLYAVPADGLKFHSPRETAMVTSSRQALSTTAPRILQYELSGMRPGAHPLVVDITDTAPLLMSTSVIGEHLRFSAREANPRTYIATHLESIPSARLQPMPDQPDLRAAGLSADYLIITHPMFAEGIGAFAEAKRRAGHAVQVVNIEHIYDQFAAGQRVPHAIRRFLHYATGNWGGSSKGPAATYVLLVGDSTSAYRNEFKNQVINYVPSMTVSETSDRFASDLWFGTTMGADLLADSFIGRFSVNNTGDLRNVLAKQESYTAPQSPGPWQNTLAYVADHSEFEEATEGVIDRTVPSRFFLNRLMLSEEPWIDNYYFPLEIAEAKKSKVSPVMTAKIRDMFNNGAAMVTYFGHGSPNVWSNERIWFGGDSENSDNHMLTNRDRLSFIVNMTCNSGAIDYPMPRWNVCISEDFMRIPNGGAVACYVPSGPGVTSQHERFTWELNRTILQERKEPLGPALALANWRYLLAGNPPDLTRMFILLGDPALRLNLADPVDASRGSATGKEPQSGVPVPEEFSADPGPGWYQYVRHGKDFAASAIAQWTTGTSVLSPPKSPPDGGAIVVPVLSATGAEGSARSTVVQGPSEAQIELLHAGTVGREGETQIWRLLVRNTTRVPVSALQLQLRDREGRPLGSSATFRLAPGEQRRMEIAVPEPASFMRLYPAYRTHGSNWTSLKTEDPVISLPGNPTSSAAIDPASVQVSYSASMGSINAAVSCRVYSLTSDTLQNLVLQLTGPAHGITSTTIAVNNGSHGTIGTLAIPLEQGSTDKYEISLLNQDSQPIGDPVPVQVSAESFGDLSLSGEEVSVTPESPMDGETVFFDAVVRNAGRSAIAGIKVEGYEAGGSTLELPLDRRVSGHQRTFALEPGSSQSVRLRWDPFRNAGKQDVLLRVSSSTNAAELRLDNNQTTVSLQVRTKSKVRPVNIGILPLTPEDRAAKQIKVVATLRNDGESPAQGVRVVFYPTPKVTPNDVMGEVILDVVPAGETREAVLTYKLKPGEETRPFLPSCETMLKGSLQRTPLVQDRSGQ